MSVSWFGRPLPCGAVRPHRRSRTAGRPGRRRQRMAAAEHHRHHGDPAAPGAHVLAEQGDGAERQLRPGQAAQRAARQHRGDAVAGDADAQGLRRIRPFADAAQPQAPDGAEQEHRDQRSPVPRRHRPGDDCCGLEHPVEPGQAGDDPRQHDARQILHRRVGEGAADTPNRMRSRKAVSPEASRLRPMPITIGSPRNQVAPKARMAEKAMVPARATATPPATLPV